MRIALIVAAATNGVIGRDNTLPWHLPNDLKYFKATTLGRPVIMGRKTWESIGKPLPGRTNIVVSRQPGFHAEGATTVSSVDVAISMACDIAAHDGVDEVMVIGGETIYREALPLAHRIYLTEVHADVAGDAVFPALAAGEWQEITREKHAACEKNPYDYSFVIMDRKE